VRVALLKLELTLLFISRTPHGVSLDDKHQYIPDHTKGLRNGVWHQIREMLTESFTGVKNGMRTSL
jgi:hypothetical protein